ncbi:Kinesin-related protein 3 [Hondaea fermentalgiana]|uniref:Kinesin-like protein n=1 Tax=Hondaea fermentalgiana TaxID=2315210 RepID=A0A2R5GSQ1_9STRA|nr:Kinesin-related protein 3 [Hondaea fermentalgiana]|eukprot:GBG33339.1 Kinesin-related protein 3 [Hondaea fermentalgiana]
MPATPSGSGGGGSGGGEGAASSVHVVVRVRPQNAKEEAAGGKVAVKVSKEEIQVDNVGSLSGEGVSRFTFDRVFQPESTQAEVFESIGRPLVENVFEGYNGTIFAYGQTSSGKTHTMQGPNITDPELAGIIPRTVEAIFQYIARAGENMEFTVRGSYVEIYLERIRDLLDVSRQNLQVREDPNRGIYVEHMSERYVNSFEEMMELMALGAGNRAQAATGMNEGSSRSHSVFVLQLVQTDTTTGTTKTSKINLVDLAGSEMVRKTGATGDRLDEAKMINLSLSALGKVINALTDGKSAHVPYRDSKLTRMLQESLGGNARTWLVINVSPSSYNALETINTLRFGNRAKAIKNKAVVNQVRTVEELEALLAQAERAIDVQAQYIEKLKRRLAQGGDDSRGDNAEAKKASADDGEDGNRQSSEDLAKQIVTLELQIKELRDAHESDVQELERSNAEIQILSQELNEAKRSGSGNGAGISGGVGGGQAGDGTGVEAPLTPAAAGSAEQIATAQAEKEALQNKLDEAESKYAHLEHQLKEVELNVNTLQKENERLNKELDAVPIGAPAASVASAVEAPAVGPDAPLEEQLAAAKEEARRLRADLEQKTGTYEATIQDLRSKVGESSSEAGAGTGTSDGAAVAAAAAATSASAASGGAEGKSMDPALEQRLYQLIAVHKQLLRKYAYAELAAAEKTQLLTLKEERIKVLENNIKSKEFNFRAQAERHALEIEDMQIERQKEVQQLQLEVARARRELNEQKSSFGAKALAFMNKTASGVSPGRSTASPLSKSPPQGNRIVKPLRGGGDASSGQSAASTGGGGGVFGWLSSSSKTTQGSSSAHEEGAQGEKPPSPPSAGASS